MGATQKDAESAIRDSAEDGPLRVLISAGLVFYGVVHLLVAWIAVQVAWGGSSSGQEASQQGALREMGGSTLGNILLWITAVGMAGLVFWQLGEAIWGYREKSDKWKKRRRRAASVGRAVLYGALSYNAASIAIGSSGGSGGSGGGQKEETATAQLLGNTWGQVLVTAAGVVIIVIGGRQIRRGLKKKFTDDLHGHPPETTIRLGQVGFVAKGIAIAIVGGLFCWAAFSHDPEKAGGLDDALRTLREGPFGTILLTVLALGLAAFGLYCFAWARQPRR